MPPGKLRKLHRSNFPEKEAPGVSFGDFLCFLCRFCRKGKAYSRRSQRADLLFLIRKVQRSRIVNDIHADRTVAPDRKSLALPVCKESKFFLFIAVSRGPFHTLGGKHQRRPAVDYKLAAGKPSPGKLMAVELQRSRIRRKALFF